MKREDRTILWVDIELFKRLRERKQKIGVSMFRQANEAVKYYLDKAEGQE